MIKKDTPKEQELKQVIKESQQEYRNVDKQLTHKERIKATKVYWWIEKIHLVMDNWLVDPLIGLIPGIGDTISSVVALPFVYVSIFKIRSLPLTLAIIYNVMRDVFIGLIPFWIGNFLDVLNRCHKQNFRLIVGYVEEDPVVMREVRKKAAFSALGIVCLAFFIYLLLRFVGWLWTTGQEVFNTFLSSF